jgi:hypothetical protein
MAPNKPRFPTHTWVGLLIMFVAEAMLLKSTGWSTG